MRVWFERLCGLLAALALFAIMALTLVDVVGRKLADRSVPGSLELTEILMVVVIFASLPLVSLHGEHVLFDSIDRWLPRWFRALQARAVDVLCAATMAGLAWLMWSKAGQMADAGDVTAQLGLPLGPFVRLMAVLCAVTAAVHVALLVRPASHHHVGVDDGDAAAADAAAAQRVGAPDGR